MAELVDAHDSKSCAFGRAGSIPALGTKGWRKPSFFRCAIINDAVAAVYILYSEKLSRFYTGSCKEILFRLQDHLDKVYTGSFTANSDDWQLFVLIDDLTYAQARAIESHIKKMKSRIFIENLAKYPEMIIKLRQRYS